MELWIRSQKNEKLRPLLLKVNEFEIGDYDDDMNCIVVNNLHCVGIYKNKKRALRVLDEIQDKLKVLVTDEAGAEFILARNLVPIIYEMPKE